MKYALGSFLVLYVVCIMGCAEAENMEEKNILILPKPKTHGEISLEESINKRRSVRSYKSQSLEMEQISQLLWSAQGITDKRSGFRAAPSAGATYPLETYLVNSDGVFQYLVDDHSLKKIKAGDVRGALTEAAWGQRFIQQAPISIVICAIRKRTTARYGERGNRYIDIEVGHAAENLHLQAVALGLSSVPVGAFTDGEVGRILGLPRGTDPIYIIPVGYKE